MGDINTIPVVVTYVSGDTDRTRRPCIPSPRFESMEATRSLCLAHGHCSNADFNIYILRCNDILGYCFHRYNVSQPQP